MMIRFLVSGYLLFIVSTGAADSQTLPPPDDNLNIFALPVGQGDCTVIQCPATYGKEISIIDAGSSDYVVTGFDGNSLANYIIGQRIKQIVLTHPDIDHINHVDNIFDGLRKAGTTNFPPVYHSCDWSSYQDAVKDKDVANTEQRIHKCCGLSNCNQKLSMCNGAVSISILGSEHDSCKKGGGNGDSIVTMVEYENTRYALGVGDFEGSAPFIKSFLSCADISAKIYRLAHHGTCNGEANTDPFLSAIKAEYVFSSSGLTRKYKHPCCDMYEYYKNQSHPAATVKRHAYACFDKTSSDSTPTLKHTVKAIYATTVIDDDATHYTSYFVQFAINQMTKTISPNLIKLTKKDDDKYIE